MLDKIKSVVDRIAKNQIYSTICLMLSVALLFTCCTVSFAWFIDYLRSGDIGFATGELDDSILEIAKVEHTMTESERKYAVVSGTIEKDATLNSDGVHYDITLSDMSFGMIDNVAMLKPENVVYFRFTIPKKNGTEVSLRFYYNPEFYNPDEDLYEFADLYYTLNEGDAGKTKMSDEKVPNDNSKTVLSAFCGLEAQEDDCFVKYSVLLSNEEKTASELSSLEFNNLYELNDSASFFSEEITDPGEYYYVYVRVEPNLSLLSHSIEYISSYMPCSVYYKIGATLEVKHSSES